MNGGYHIAFLLGAVFVVSAAAVGLALLRARTVPEPTAAADATVEPAPASAE